MRFLNFGSQPVDLHEQLMSDGNVNAVEHSELSPAPYVGHVAASPDLGEEPGPETDDDDVDLEFEAEVEENIREIDNMTPAELVADAIDDLARADATDYDEYPEVYMAYLARSTAVGNIAVARMLLQNSSGAADSAS